MAMSQARIARFATRKNPWSGGGSVRSWGSIVPEIAPARKIDRIAGGRLLLFRLRRACRSSGAPRAIPPQVLRIGDQRSQQLDTIPVGQRRVQTRTLSKNRIGEIARRKP